jgi:hypothetical protein
MLDEKSCLSVSMVILIITVTFAVYLALSNNNIDLLWVLSEQGEF